MVRVAIQFRRSILAASLLAAGTIACSGAAATTPVIDVMPGQLNTALAAAPPGSTLRLSPGLHQGPVVIDKPLKIVGTGNDTTIEGNGTGHVIAVHAPNVVIENLRVTGSGLLLETQDAGIFLGKEAKGARVENNRIENNLIGVYVWGARDAIVRGNRIAGRQDLRVNERGNGVQIWNAPGAVVEGNRIRFGRDGIFVTTSKKNIFRNNHFADLRFGVHYMYTNSSEISGNVSEGNHIGYAIMFSKRIKVLGNESRNDRDRGILFNYANQVRVRGNRVTGGPEKCVFIYNSNKNKIDNNHFASCDIGVHFTGGSERNSITGNAFIGNRTQVKYVGTRWIEWSEKGRGNYWSDHAAFDLDGNGIADTAFRPNDLTDQILWRFPIAKLLTNAPAVLLLKWAQAAFPALHPGGVIDSAPLMQPVTLSAEEAGR